LRDNLKTLVPSALIQTYSYKPLTGVISITDPNGMTTRYDYDSFGRLKTIKDNDEKILKSYKYNYSK
jgi:YD repeat-containing protein